MREFFRGWQRKLGLVALMIALAAMAAWMHSQRMVHVIAFRGCSMPLTVISGCGEFALLRRNYFDMSFEPTAEGTNRKFYFEEAFAEDRRRFEIVRLSMKASKLEIFIYTHPPHALSWKTVDRIRITPVPYWTVILALSAFSASLLLFKRSNAENEKKREIDEKKSV